MNDSRLYWTVLVYFGGLVLLHVAWWQALVISAAVAISWILSFHRRLLTLGGLVIVGLGFANWTGLIQAGTAYLKSVWAG